MARNKQRSGQDDFFFTFSFVVVITVLIGLLLGYLWIYNSVTRTIKQNMALRQMQTQLENTNKELKGELSVLSRGDRIKRIARTQLHMVTPEPETLAVFIDNEYLLNQEETP